MSCDLRQVMHIYFHSGKQNIFAHIPNFHIFEKLRTQKPINQPMLHFFNNMKNPSKYAAENQPGYYP